MTYSLSVNTDGPADPLYVLELAEGFAEIARALNHVTRRHSALEFPPEADAMLRYVQTAVSRLPQLLGQTAAWLAEEQAAGRIRMAGGDHDAAVAVSVARAALADAGRLAAQIELAIGAATARTGNMAATEVREDDGHDS